MEVSWKSVQRVSLLNDMNMMQLHSFEENPEHCCFFPVIARLGVWVDACQGSKPMLKKKGAGLGKLGAVLVLRSVWWWHVVKASVGFEVLPVQTAWAWTLGMVSTKSPSHSIWGLKKGKKQTHEKIVSGRVTPGRRNSNNEIQKSSGNKGTKGSWVLDFEDCFTNRFCRKTHFII